MLSEASVVLVVVAEGTKAGCKLKVERTLKGEPPRSLPQCRAPAKGDWMTTFDAHGDARFWKENHGRLGINGDCSLVAPAFTIGKRYLLLIGVQPDTKQAEELGANDRWLAFAEAHLNGKKRGA